MQQKKKDFVTGILIGLSILTVLLVTNPQHVDSIIFRLCDGFFVAGVMVMGFGGLMHARNKGVFDMMEYSVSSVFRLKFPGFSIGRAREDEEDFIAFRDRKAGVRRSAAGFLLSGGIYMILAVLFMILYYVV